MDVGPFTPDPMGGLWPVPFPWLSFGFSGPVPGYSLKHVSGGGSVVSTVQAKLNAKVDYADEDLLFSSWTYAATQLVEHRTGTRLTPQVLQLSLPMWPMDGLIRFPVYPVTGVNSLQYYNAAGTLTTLTEGTDFLSWLDYRPPVVLPYPGKYWPVVQFGRIPTILVQFNAGYGQEGGPPAPPYAAQAVLMTIAYWAANRGDEDAPQRYGLPEGAVRLMKQLDRTGGYR